MACRGPLSERSLASRQGACCAHPLTRCAGPPGERAGTRVRAGSLALRRRAARSAGWHSLRTGIWAHPPTPAPCRWAGGKGVGGRGGREGRGWEVGRGRRTRAQHAGDGGGGWAAERRERRGQHANGDGGGGCAADRRERRGQHANGDGVGGCAAEGAKGSTREQHAAAHARLTTAAAGSEGSEGACPIPGARLQRARGLRESAAADG